MRTLTRMKSIFANKRSQRKELVSDTENNAKSENRCVNSETYCVIVQIIRRIGALCQSLARFFVGSPRKQTRKRGF